MHCQVRCGRLISTFSEAAYPTQDEINSLSVSRLDGRRLQSLICHSTVVLYLQTSLKPVIFSEQEPMSSHPYFRETTGLFMKSFTGPGAEAAGVIGRPGRLHALHDAFLNMCACLADTRARRNHSVTPATVGSFNRIVLARHLDDCIVHKVETVTKVDLFRRVSRSSAGLWCRPWASRCPGVLVSSECGALML